MSYETPIKKGFAELCPLRNDNHWDPINSSSNGGDCLSLYLLGQHLMDTDKILNIMGCDPICAIVYFHAGDCASEVSPLEP